MISSPSSPPFSYLGFGLGLRSQHYEAILESSPPIDWFEILTENYLGPGGRPFYYLDRIRERYPIVMHGVSLSLGSCDPLNLNYLEQVKKLTQRVQPAWISDHLCWTGINQINTHDLLPLPYTHEAIDHVVARIQHVQDYLERQILIENVSSYLTYRQSEMPEWEFISQIAVNSGCLMLLDVNNIYVSAFNHHFNPQEYLNGIPRGCVQQIHLAGHTQRDHYIIDTHDAPVIESVWELYTSAIKRFGAVSTMIERDDHIPELAELVDEVNHARAVANSVLQEPVSA
jgi:hypothetical protein